jgi:predicted metallopeptidase
MEAHREGRGMTEIRNANRSTVDERHPLVRCWGHTHKQLSVQYVRGTGRPQPTALGSGPPPWLQTGRAGEPFDFCAAIRQLADDVIGRCPEFGHIRTSNILFAMTQARNALGHGLQARVTPMRFRGGALARRHRGKTFQVQRYFVDGNEILYLMTFCLPRFLNQGFDDKFVTLFHELYHIGPQFDGDLRRHAGRYSVHSHSQRHYDQRMADLARAYLGLKPDPALHAFLRLGFAQLCQRHGQVAGVTVPRPKLVPVPDATY